MFFNGRRNRRSQRKLCMEKTCKLHTKKRRWVLNLWPWATVVPYSVAVITHTRSIVYQYIISALCLFCVFFFFSVYTDIVMNHRGGLVMLVLYCESSIQEMWIDNKRECQASKYITSEFGLETVTVWTSWTAKPQGGPKLIAVTANLRLYYLSTA